MTGSHNDEFFKSLDEVNHSSKPIPTNLPIDPPEIIAKRVDEQLERFDNKVKAGWIGLEPIRNLLLEIKYGKQL